MSLLDLCDRLLGGESVMYELRNPDHCPVAACALDGFQKRRSVTIEAAQKQGEFSLRSLMTATKFSRDHCKNVVAHLLFHGRAEFVRMETVNGKTRKVWRFR